MSTVLIDPREGSGNLLPYLQELRVPSRHERLEYGDVQIIGRGPEERPVLIGIEIKAPGDLLTSIQDGRLIDHQIPGLLTMYEQVYLLIESFPVRKKNGDLGWVGRKKTYGNWTYDRLIGHLTTYENKLGIRYDFTANRPATADWVAAKHKWWTGDKWDQHRSHMTLRKIEPDADPIELYTMTKSKRRKLTVARAMADGVGWARARAAADYFQTAIDMVNAEPDELKNVPGIGPKLAHRMWAEMRRYD